MDPYKLGSTSQRTSNPNVIDISEWKAIRAAIDKEGIPEGTRKFMYKGRIVPLYWEPKPLQITILSFGTEEEADSYMSGVLETTEAHNSPGAEAAPQPHDCLEEESPPNIQKALSTLHISDGENASIQKSVDYVEEVELPESTEPSDGSPSKPAKHRRRRKKQGSVTSTPEQSGTIKWDVQDIEMRKTILQHAMEDAGIITKGSGGELCPGEKFVRDKFISAALKVTDDVLGSLKAESTDEARIGDDPTKMKKSDIRLDRELKDEFIFKPYPKNASDLKDWKDILFMIDRQEISPGTETVFFRGRLVPIRWDCVSARPPKRFVRPSGSRSAEDQSEVVVVDPLAECDPLTAGASPTVPHRLPERRLKNPKGKHSKLFPKDE